MLRNLRGQAKARRGGLADHARRGRQHIDTARPLRAVRRAGPGRQAAGTRWPTASRRRCGSSPTTRSTRPTSARPRRSTSSGGSAGSRGRCEAEAQLRAGCRPVIIWCRPVVSAWITRRKSRRLLGERSSLSSRISAAAWIAASRFNSPAWMIRRGAPARTAGARVCSESRTWQRLTPSFLLLASVQSTLMTTRLGCCTSHRAHSVPRSRRQP